MADKAWTWSARRRSSGHAAAAAARWPCRARAGRGSSHPSDGGAGGTLRRGRPARGGRRSSTPPQYLTRPWPTTPRDPPSATCGPTARTTPWPSTPSGRPTSSTSRCRCGAWPGIPSPGGGPSEVRAVAPGARVWQFGHLGDGNIHVNVTGVDPDDESVDDAVLRLVARSAAAASAPSTASARPSAAGCTSTARRRRLVIPRRSRRALDLSGSGILNPARACCPTAESPRAPGRQPVPPRSATVSPATGCQSPPGPARP